MRKKRVLIANRGEIASRILRTCKTRGYETVIIYSEADASLPYLREADEIALIGPPPVSESYMKVDSIIKIAKDYNVDFIHPGYGLLSENGMFARKCEESSIIFVGPSSNVIKQMGDKITARKLMAESEVPVIPGMEKEAESIEDTLKQTNELGYPVMLKASAGGGGIGMHICYSDEEVRRVFSSAKRRALSTFGNDRVYIEKYIANSRHIEVQVVGDSHGNVVHMFERDCSVQRRHQKVIEESPSSFLDEKTRIDLCETAVRAARAIDYTGVGTVEFIMDEDKNFYFLEMNTRLQVEHPVTEAITGHDLVSLQFIIAEGERLPFEQSELSQNGHAMEFRIYAEDPKTFLPSPGTIREFKRVNGKGIRFDDAIEEGVEVTPFYDPMIAKLIVHDSSRGLVLERGKHVLDSIRLEGLKNNIPFLKEILKNEKFKKGDYTTKLTEEMKRKKSEKKK